VSAKPVDVPEAGVEHEPPALIAHEGNRIVSRKSGAEAPLFLFHVVVPE
jgi:hypothetical protein